MSEDKSKGKKDCKFCEGTGQVRDRFGFYVCICVRHGQRTG